MTLVGLFLYTLIFSKPSLTSTDNKVFQYQRGAKVNHCLQFINDDSLQPKIMLFLILNKLHFKYTITYLNQTTHHLGRKMVTPI